MSGRRLQKAVPTSRRRRRGAVAAAGSGTSTRPWPVSASSPTAPSTVARLAAQAARLEAATAAAVGHLTSALPSLGRKEADAALVTAVPIPTRGAARYLEELAGHLAAHPDALTSGSSVCPPVLLRLAEVLHDAGHSVVRPGCAHCGKIGLTCGNFALRGGSAVRATPEAADAKPARGASAKASASSPGAPRGRPATVVTAPTPPRSRSAPSAGNSDTRWYDGTTAEGCASSAGNAPCTPA